MTTENKISDSELNDLRDKYLRRTVEPTIRWVFKKFPHIQSCTVRVAQYWDDEASDAVHAQLIFSELETPLTETEENEQGERNFSLTPGLRTEIPWEGWKYKDLDTREYDWKDKWSDNWTAIPLFAAWCSEGAHQNMDDDEAYSNYCTYRKTDAGVQRELYPMIREWLNGVEPEWTNGEHDVFVELRTFVAKVPPSIIGEDIPYGPLTDEIRRMLDVCGAEKSYSSYDYGAGRETIKTYKCHNLRMLSGRCDEHNCPFKKE